MHLLQRTLKGVPPPPTLPAPLTTCVKLALNPQLPVADEKHMQKCRSAFGAFHENIGKGVLGGEGGGAGSGKASVRVSVEEEISIAKPGVVLASGQSQR